MKIVHLCLSCFYIDGFTYQENMLVRQHVADGHDVVVIASTENYGEDRKHIYVEPSTYMGTDGARVIRLPYRKFLPHKVMRKLRMHPGVSALLEREKPDAVLFHGLCGFELLTVAHFKRRHPAVPVYADSHEYGGNSARSAGARLLHKLFYGPIIRYSQPAYDKILSISVESMAFVQKMYGVPPDRLEFYPLGGLLLDDKEYAERRKRMRAALGLTKRQVLLLQTGKLDRRKKLVETLQALAAVPAPNIRLAIAGSLHPEIEQQAQALISADSRVQFLGWKNSGELLDLLCAADVYLQPGTQSATMQMSLCARCPVILDDVPSHQPFIHGNGWPLRNISDLDGILRNIAAKPGQLAEMAANSFAIASRLLDYKSLSTRVLR